MKFLQMQENTTRHLKAHEMGYKINYYDKLPYFDAKEIVEGSYIILRNGLMYYKNLVVLGNLKN